MSKQDNGSDKLLEKKADTRSGKREVKIKKSSWSFRPKVEHSTNRSLKINVPTIDKIARVYMRNKGIDRHHAMEELDDDAEDDSEVIQEDIVGIYRQLLSYSLTEEYKNSVRPSGYDTTDVQLQPYLFIEMVSETEDVVYASVSDPFRTENCRRLLSATQDEESVFLEYEDDGPVVIVGDEKYCLSHVRSANEDGSLERQLIDALDNHSYEGNFIRSEYDGWARIPVDRVYNESDLTVIETDDEDHLDWVFDEPVIWDETEDLVRLVESFANGDSSQLESIYIRPSGPESDESSVRTATHNEFKWEIALEEPDAQEDSGKVERLLKNIFLACTISLFIFLLAFLVV